MFLLSVYCCLLFAIWLVFCALVGLLTLWFGSLLLLVYYVLLCDCGFYYFIVNAIWFCLCSFIVLDFVVLDCFFCVYVLIWLFVFLFPVGGCFLCLF